MDNELTGLLLIDKESGPTSHDIIDRLRKVTGIRKIGHSGTLDPFATGLLLCFISRAATKKIQGYMHLDKEYIATISLGSETDTYDREGKVTFKAEEIHFQKILAQLPEVLESFRGKIEQVPPMYSALKVKGKKMYELARQGKEIERKPREVFIDELKLLEVNSGESPSLVVRVRCSTGTYIRSLAFDIGRALGVGAHLTELRRTKIGAFSVEDALPAHDLDLKKIEKAIRAA